MKFWEELRRRKIFQVATVYIVVGWLVTQVAVTVFPPLNLPPWTITLVVALVILGFPVALVLAWAFQLTASPETLSFESSTPLQKPFGRKRTLLISGFAIIVLVSGAYFLIRSSAMNSENKKISIAIIPFRNQSKNEKLDGYSFGIASEIRTQLAMGGQFDFVSSDQATLKYLDSKQTPKEIASELGVDYLLFGSFYQLDDKLKISAELADGSSNKSLWSLPPSDASVSSIQEMFDAQSVVSVKVMQWFSMKGEISSKPPTENLTAYDYFRKGSELQNLLDTACMLYFRKAIELDSNFISPRLGLLMEHASTYWSNGSDRFVREKELRPEMDAIERISTEAWETQLARGYFYYWGLKDFNKGLHYFRKTLEVNPSSDRAVALIGVILRRQMKSEEAFPYLIRSVEMNPISVQNQLNLVYFYDHTGDLHQACEALDRARKLGVILEEDWDLSIEVSRDSGDFNMIPKKTRAFNQNRFEMEKYASEGNWKEVVKYPGKINKAIGYYVLGNADSAKFYALKQVEWARLNNNPWFVSILLAIAGDYEGAMRTVDEDSDLVFPTHFGNNLLNVCFRERQRIQVLAIIGKYEEATSKLLEFNKQYPGWGGYKLLFHGFETEKIRNEYPPFMEALKNIKYPPRMPYPKRLDNSLNTSIKRNL